jgi:hypothetical protein
VGEGWLEAKDENMKRVQNFLKKCVMRGMGKKVEIDAASILVPEAERVPETVSFTCPPITPPMGC